MVTAIAGVCVVILAKIKVGPILAEKEAEMI